MENNENRKIVGWYTHIFISEIYIEHKWIGKKPLNSITTKEKNNKMILRLNKWAEPWYLKPLNSKVSKKLQKKI